MLAKKSAPKGPQTRTEHAGHSLQTPAVNILQEATSADTQTKRFPKFSPIPSTQALQRLFRKHPLHRR